MSERRVRLLYKTACWQCDEPIEAGVVTWWDDDRHHATCTDCFPDRDGLPDGGDDAPPITLDLRTQRRLELLRSRRTARPDRRPDPRRPDRQLVTALERSS